MNRAADRSRCLVADWGRCSNAVRAGTLIFHADSIWRHVMCCVARHAAHCAMLYAMRLGLRGATRTVAHIRFAEISLLVQASVAVGTLVGVVNGAIFAAGLDP